MNNTSVFLKELLKVQSEFKRMGISSPELQKVIDEIQTGKNDYTNISIKTNVNLQKFDGEYEEGKEPIETVKIMEIMEINDN